MRGGGFASAAFFRIRVRNPKEVRSRMWSTIFPYILSGISVGGQYALIAIGYTMVYGVLGLINVAHGDVCRVSGILMVYMVA